jgi:hypothetical protein
MGERAQIGSLIYNAFDTAWSVALGEGPAARIPANRFLLLHVSVVNSGPKPASVPTFTLVDDSGKIFDELSSGAQVPNWIGVTRTVKPAESEQGNILFDVQPQHYKLRIADPDDQKFAFIDLPLNFNPEPRPNSPQ